MALERACCPYCDRMQKVVRVSGTPYRIFVVHQDRTGERACRGSESLAQILNRAE